MVCIWRKRRGERTNQGLVCRQQHQHARLNEEGKKKNAIYRCCVCLVCLQRTTQRSMQIVSFLSGVYPATNCTVSLMGKKGCLRVPLVRFLFVLTKEYYYLLHTRVCAVDHDSVASILKDCCLVIILEGTVALMFQQSCVSCWLSIQDQLIVVLEG